MMGGFITPIVAFDPVADNVGIEFREELLDAFEIGIKATLGNGTTTFNGSIFFYDYQDHQIQV